MSANKRLQAFAVGPALHFVSHCTDILREDGGCVNDKQANLNYNTHRTNGITNGKSIEPLHGRCLHQDCRSFFLSRIHGQFAQKTADPRCLSYEPAVVQLTGTLIHKVYPGPPDYKDLRRGDAPEVLWLLNLAMPICVDQDKEQPDLNASHKKIRTIQLVLPVEFYSKYKDLLGKQIIVTGKLFGAHTIHHRTPVLLTVSSLARADQPLHERAGACSFAVLPFSL
jgi:hypothetical protein